MRLAILCPDPADPTYGARILPPIDGYRRLFAALDVEVEALPWVDPSPAGFDGALASLAWGYHFRIDAWEARLRTWDPSVPLINPPHVLLWNTRKTYLQDLAGKGVRTVPTLTPALTTVEAIEGAFDGFGVSELVIKPLVSAGSHETTRLKRGDSPPPPASGRMVQPFLPSVEGEGELSLFFFGGRFSHAVAKVAAEGDFRVQPQFGGKFRSLQPDDEAMALANAALSAAPEGLVYARIDLIRDLEGRLALMELEAIEPDLYFDFAPDQGRAFGLAVLEQFKTR